MAKRIFSNKALAVVLVLAVLMSCMVFSFGGANAAQENLMWENDFTAAEGTSTNWMKAYTNSSDNAWYANGSVNKAVYDSENSWMSLEFTGTNSWTYMSGFAMFHKSKTHATTGEYGYHGGEDESGVMDDYGAFRPTQGTYKVTLKYKVESFSTTAGAVADICVGFASRTGWKWYGNPQRATFINSSNKGVYEIAATVDASTANTWQTATVTIDQPLNEAMLMHVFARNNDNAGKELAGTTILVDEIKVYEVEVPTAKKMWQNSFTLAEGTSSNWLAGYQVSDHAWTSTGSGVVASYDSTNEAMEIAFQTDDYSKIGGFGMFHETATHTTANEYGYIGVGNSEGAALTGYGVFRPAQGTYAVSLDYKVTDFSDVEGAAIDICVGFARRTKFNWIGTEKTRASFVSSDATYNGVYTAIATVTASDKGKDWRTATITIDQPYNDTSLGMMMHIFARTSENVTNKSLNGSTLLIDNVKVYSTDAALDQSVNDRYHYLYRGNVGTEENPVYTNLHTNTNNPDDPNPYTSIRIGMRYMAGDDTGKTIIINGKEYEIVERGILVGLANRTLNINNRKWISSKSTDLGNYWLHESVSGGHRISYTLRLANMGEAWFKDNTSYQCRSYYKIKVPFVDADGSFGEETFTVYGGVSGTFTFGSLASTFDRAYWFPSLTTES